MLVGVAGGMIFNFVHFKLKIESETLITKLVMIPAIVVGG